MRRPGPRSRLASSAVKNRILLLVVGLASGAPLACSSSSSSNPGAPKDASTGSDVAIINDPQNCVPPGTPNNAAGVGGYCSPGGGQCANAGPEAGGTICTADFGSVVPAHAWFCTDLCELDASDSCGVGGPPCVSAEGELVCLPNACMGFLAGLEDGGTDAPAGDAPSGDAHGD
jgi:hypothetical protein